VQLDHMIILSIDDHSVEPPDHFEANPTDELAGT
jgi:hypothetical protein